MTRKELPARAANLHRAVASTTSCTPATVESLRSFLLPRENAVTTSNKPAAKAPAPKTKGSSVRPTGSEGARARKQPVIDVLEILGDADAQAQIQDRTALATEVVNATLKALSEAIRKPLSQKRRAPLRRTSSNASFSNGVESRSQTPLQPMSVNRLANIPLEKDHSRRSSTTSIDGKLAGIRAQAECSRIAFACLRSVQGRNASPPIPHLQLESGMSALIGRLITLGFDDLAVKELRILKRRLEAAMGSSGQQKLTKHMCPPAREDAVEPKTETLVEMLRFSSLKAQGLLLALIVTTQLQVIRILVLKREASMTEAALQHLRLEVVHSPANLIQQQIKSESPDSRDKAAYQLETLAQSLITLCPSPSTTEDYRHSKSSSNLAPHIVFELQFLAFQIRSVWWKISGHRTNIATEMINPFARCMATFHRRSKMDGTEKYKIGLSAFEFIADISQTTTDFREEMLLGVYQVLADMAQENSQYIEASRWVKKSVNSARGGGISQTQLCILDCRLASLMIRAIGPGSSEDLLESLQVAASSLAGNLHGETAELDELLTIIASLRRSAFSVIQNAYKQHKTDRGQTPLIVDTCSEIISLCVKFLLRYLGNGPRQQEDEKTTARREQRRASAAQVSNPTIDSFAAVANLSSRTTVDQWLKLDRGLRDCWRLALILKGPHFGEKETSEEAKREPSFHFVSISNAYWYRYLHLKQVAADIESLRDCLRMSIDIIRNGPPCERTAGCLSTKLEKYAQLCENVRDYKKATETYEEVIHTHIENGLLSIAMEAATTRSMPNALEDNGALVPLSQSLVAYPKAALKAIERGCSVDAFYDDNKLCDDKRGVLLEQQLIGLLNISQDQGSTPMISQALTALVQDLLSLYTETVYPVRRYRVIVRLLAVLSANPDALDDANREQVLREPPAISRKPHQDVHLLGYLLHLTVCRDVLINLNNGTLGVEKVEAVMANWTKLLHEHPAWIALQLQVYDMSDWLSQLEHLAGYLEIKGLGLTRVSVLHVLVTVHEASTSMQCLNLVSKLTELGLQYSRLGYSGAAGVVLHKAERYLATSDVPAKLALRFHLVQAEIAHTSGIVKRCSDHLDKARELFQEDAASVDNQRVRSKDQSERSQLMGDAAYLLSLRAAAEGHSPKALYLARLCVKSYQRAWAIMERRKQRKPMTARGARNEVEVDSIVDCLSEIAISESATVETMTEEHSPPSPCGAAFWSIVPRLSRGFIHLSSLFAHHGLLLEARYSLDQAQRITNTVHARALIGQHSALLGQYISRGGESNEGLQLLQQAESLLSGIPRGSDYASLQLSFASHYAKHRQWQAGDAALDVAETTVKKLMKKGFMDALIHKQKTLEDLDLQLGTLTLKETKTASKPKFRSRTTVMRKDPLTKPGVQEDSTIPPADEIPTIEVIALKRVKGEILLGRASTALDKGDLESARLLLSEPPSYSCDEPGIVSQALLSSRIRYSQKLEHLVADPVFCVIPESTISHPSIRVGGDGKQHQITSNAAVKALSVAPVKNQRGKTPANKRRPSLGKNETDVLHLARNHLTDVVKLARKVSSTETLHKITDALAKILLLLSATSSSASKTSVSPAFVVYTLEIGRILSMVRESAAIDVERQLSLTKITHHWPEEDAFEYHHTTGASTALDFATFQAEYIDIIPSNWTTISMTLTESREELLICKIRAGQSPFILRLPLTRHNPLESDEETFGFDQGSAELQEILLSANQSTHGAQELSQKGAKTKWWEARTALDARLKDLLYNIESIWFGGFKSVFSHAVQDPNLLARFQQSLQNILDKHLPSRRKSGRGSQGSRITLDQSVLELFVGLGNPSESDDVDEPLMDLLYFVVDIMQFNGERNAYDEIDFDSIVIETLDALRYYHQAVKDEAESNEEQHTILILDKHLHCFPWESLPCLSGQAVSRLPSLKCLRDRIMQQREVSEGENPSPKAGKIYVNRNSGTSILNPGGDLKATQSRFEEPLLGLPEWETIVQREPTETEMKDCLENHEILLYFGHGSGGQYIRARTIKKLDKCAVALLMGCSSGALTDAGEFEPYGTPMNYMHAGSPAMLATLWDVTDKDIDKFSKVVLEKWGLFGEAKPPVPGSPKKKSAKQRGKSKVKDVEETKAVENGPVSLDEAVAQARESCLLRYLNGAAPVVYGVPVFLS